MKMKMCCTCKVEYLANNDNFSNHKGQPDGFCKQCKMCVKAYKARYYAKNKEKVDRKNMENYYKKNLKEVYPEGHKKCSRCETVKLYECFGESSKSKDGMRYSCKNCQQEEYLDNHEYNLKRQKKWYEENKEYALKTQKKYVHKNIEKKRRNDKIYYQKNKELIIERSKQYMYKRLETDMGFKILQRSRKRLWAAVKGYDKSATTRELIGCSNDKLIEHLENQFTTGMTWDNYGDWHIDHIMPCASFDFAKPEDQRECFNYTNLQPLWAEDNFRKSDKILTTDSAFK